MIDGEKDYLFKDNPLRFVKDLVLIGREPEMSLFN